MDQLNYHHLRYFREVAHDGTLTRAAARLNISQSALSTQIKALEARLGQPLFDRVGRRLELTEVGRIALDHADRIFDTGAELLATLGQVTTGTPPLRIGALSTLSRNFQMEFLRPVLERGDIDVTLRSGDEDALFSGLKSLALDVVLSTDPPYVSGDFIAHKLNEQKVGLHGVAHRIGATSLEELLAREAFILPTDRVIRSGFAALAEAKGMRPRIAAEVDDMAMVRLLARAGAGLAVAPAVVLADELAAGRVETAPFDLGIVESFYAVTTLRRYPHPMLKELLGAAKGGPDRA
ncbi:MAG: LysR family transcriptional regulator [Pseudomonadota bacterium]